MRKMCSLLLILSLCLGLAACGAQSEITATSGTESDTGAETDTASDSTSDTASDSDLSNTLVYAGEGVSTINPVLESHGELTDIIFSGLMKYDANGQPIEDLAESYEYDADTFTYVFTLRQDVTWHDGEAFDAEDVVFTYKELTEDETLSSSITSNYEDITDVVAVDAYTVSITLNSYNAAILDYFTVGILPQHLLEGEDINTTSFNQSPVGTGRYKLVEWDTAGGMITLERNEDYYDKVPNIERVIYKTVGDETTKATMIRSGEADLAWLNANYAAQFADDENYNSWVFTTADYRGASMDMSSDFWQDNADSIGVLNYALDKQAIVDSVLNGQGCVAYSPIQLNPLGTNSDADIYSYDLEKFDEEMEALGWAKGSDGIYERNGQRFHFTIQTRDYEEERVDIANLMSSMLLQAGVEMEVVLVTAFDWTAGYDGFLAGYATQFDPDMIYTQFVTGASDNNMHYSNAEVDALLEEGRHTEDVETRKEIYGEFEEVYAEAPGILLVAYLGGNYVGVSGLEGLDTTRVLGHHAVGVMWNIEEWTLSR
ncbi:MAG: ABC transporter substrate-binding protein [Lachnospiraceae bacterium]|nr:ABC transporter substrate-binding protein [Lachnospiraceae bacterium]